MTRLTNMALSAPGEYIVSTAPNGGYDCYGGISHDMDGDINGTMVTVYRP